MIRRLRIAVASLLRRLANWFDRAPHYLPLTEAAHITSVEALIPDRWDRGDRLVRVSMVLLIDRDDVDTIVQRLRVAR